MAADPGFDIASAVEKIVLEYMVLPQYLFDLSGPSDMANTALDSGSRSQSTGKGQQPLSHAAQASMYHFRGNQDSNRTRRPPNGFTFHQRPKIYERPLLTSSRKSPDRLTFQDDSAQEKFRDVADLTESDEEDMELSDNESAEKRPSKRIRVDTDMPSSTSKWSNPDPYTSLPPVDETTRKKKDVVRLIRKARNAAESALSARVSAAQDEDFISFNDNDERWKDEGLPPSDAPTGPRSDRPSNSDTILGKRKRVEDPKPGRLLSKRPGKQFYSDGMVLPEWKINQGCDSAPWLTPRTSTLKPAGIALHNEVLDFYEWIRPRDYETVVRANVVSRLHNDFNRLDHGGQLKAFGSYAAGLYLPTADMDLAYLLPNFNPKRKLRDGRPFTLPQAHFKRYASFLVGQEIAQPGSLTVISGAKVPIIKFVDRITGLKIDLCFNNDSGVVANETFELWKSRYPAMPIIVSIIKQFLMIRGLNDVSVGGLGGFSTICLVTSLLQHMPISGRPPNLGQLILEFFNLYGNLFNRYDIAIRLDPPGYIDKVSYAPHAFNSDKPGRLTIVDPNRPENNISGGTNEIELIFDCFRQAYELLEERLADFEKDPGSVKSFLDGIVGGDFAAYDEQRDILRKLYKGTMDHPTPSVAPPPPPPISSFPTVVPPPPPHGSATDVKDLNTGAPAANVGTETPTKNEKRASRMKKLRPDLAHKIDHSLAVAEALRLGGYTDSEAMSLNLHLRELTPETRKRYFERQSKKTKTREDEAN